MNEWVILFYFLVISAVLGIAYIFFKQKVKKSILLKIHALEKDKEDKIELYNQLQDKINEISRIENIQDLIDTFLKHLDEYFEFSLASINLVFHNKTVLENLKDLQDSKLNHFILFCKKGGMSEQWKSECNYNIHNNEENDILLKIYKKKIKDYIVVVKNDIHKIFNEERTINEYGISNQNLNQAIINKEYEYKNEKSESVVKFKHEDLARVFIPILYRNKYKGNKEIQEKEEKLNDTCFGVVEVGFLLDKELTNDQIITEVQCRLSKEVINRLFIYIDNFAQLYFRNSINFTLKKNRTYFSSARISDENFLKNSLNFIVKDFDLTCGNMSQFSIENEIQLLNIEKDIFSNEYTNSELSKIDSINKKLINSNGKNNRIGICNEVIRLYQNKRDNSGQLQKEDENKLSIIVENDIENDISQSISLKAGIKSEVGIPLITPEDNLIAICILSSSMKNFFNFYHLRVLSEFGKIFGNRILTRKRYVSVSELSQPINLFEEKDITKRLVREIKDYFGTESVLLWNLEDGIFKICKNSNEFNDNKSLIIKEDMFFNPSDFANFDENDKINFGYIKPFDKQVLVRSVNTLKPDSQIFKLCKNFKKIILLRFTTNKKYNRVITIFSHRAVSQRAVNEYADDFILTLREKFESAYQTYSMFNMLLEHKSDNNKNLYSLIVSQIKKYTNADVVGLIPNINNNNLDIDAAVIIGEEWENTQQKTFTLSEFILKDGSIKLNSFEEINNYYIKQNGYGVPNNDFINEMNSVAGIRLYNDQNGTKEFLAILMIEYRESKKFCDQGSQEYLKTLQRILSKVIWSFNQIDNDFSRLNKIIKTIEEAESINSKKIKSLEQDTEYYVEKINELHELTKELNFKLSGISFFQLSRIIHHEIFNLLNDIDRLINRTRKVLPENSKHLDVLNTIDESKSFIADLLEMTNVLDDDRVFVNISEEVNKIVRFVKRNRTEVSINYAINIDKSLEIKWNKSEFNMIIYNIISNAIFELEKLEKKDARIDILGFFEDPSYILIIEDNGPGISNDNKENIFKRGWSLKKGTLDKLENKYLGHGIGLYFVKSALEKEDYETLKNFAGIKVDSELNRYTKFILNFNKQINDI